MTTVTIPNSVTEISYDAFDCCTGLTEVIWNARNAEYYDGTSYDSPFSNCDRLTDFVFGEEVEYIPDNLCTKLNSLKNTVIDNSVKSIGKWAFHRCTGLITVTIPNSVTEIGAWAFYDCSGLTTVTIPNAVTTIEPSAFQDCSSLTTVTIGEKVESIGEFAFSHCDNLTAVISKAMTPPELWEETFEDYA